MFDYGDIAAAGGLSPEERAIVEELVDIHGTHVAHNEERMRYYADKEPMKRIGVSIPEHAPKVYVRTGWAAKAVNMLAARSILRGYTADESVEATLRRIVKRNKVSAKYDKALVSELVFGCGFWTVTEGADKQPRIQYMDALNASAVFDVMNERVKYGLAIEDYGRKDGSHGKPVPTVATLHMEDRAVRLTRSGNAWTAAHMDNMLGEPAMVSMGYRPDTARPFGRSRITPKVMATIQQAMREMERTEYHSEYSATGAKFILGAADEVFDANKFRLGSDSVLLIGKDADGDIPTVGQFSQQAIDGHIAFLNKLAEEMASETCLPVSSFGIVGSVYTSQDALDASCKDLIVEAESLNKTNGECLEQIGRMALAIAGRKALAGLTDEEDAVMVSFRDPSMPTASAMSDALAKQCGYIDGLNQSEVCLEKLGYSQDEIDRIERDKRRNAALATRDEILGAS